MVSRITCLFAVLLAVIFAAGPAWPLSDNEISYIRVSWPKTDFDRHSVDFDEIAWGGVPKDGIPSIDDPQFVRVSAVEHLDDRDPVIGIGIAGDYRAYPLQVLTRHEIVNDVVGGVPIAVTYCPLCNTSVVYDRRLDGVVLDFGVSGFLRHSDLIMYDRQTETWWQQFVGEGIVGELTSKKLIAIPARLESFANFRKRAPEGHVLAPPRYESYGSNPYVRYDSRQKPISSFFKAELPTRLGALERVITIDGEAWSLALLRERKLIEVGDLVITWEPNQASALDTALIKDGWDVGNVVVQRKTENGLEDTVYGVDFAFAFHAFHPDGVIHTE